MDGGVGKGKGQRAALHIRGGLAPAPLVWGDDVASDGEDGFEQHDEDGSDQVEAVLDPSELEMVLVVDGVVDGVLEDAQPARSLESLLQHGTATTTMATAAGATALLPDPATIMAALSGSYGVLDSWGAFFAYQEAARSGMLHRAGAEGGGYSGEERHIDRDGHHIHVSPGRGAFESHFDEEMAMEVDLESRSEWELR